MGIRIHRVIVAGLLGLLLTLTIAGFALAGYPTSVSASPASQTSSGCPPHATWTVYLAGGTSGPWTVTTNWGGGYSNVLSVSGSTSYTQNRTFAVCGNNVYLTQSRRASRAGGGTSSWSYTSVYLQY